MEDEKSEQQIFFGNEKFDIPEEGMLGLLAMGDIGLKLWREKRATMKSADEKKVADENGTASSEENTVLKI